MREVTIIGGGLAGLTAAITAAQHGSQVRLLEARAELGGRARTTPQPYRANLGPHALYQDGEFWRWLEERSLLPPTVGRGKEPLALRRRGELTDEIPGLKDSLSVILRKQAPEQTSFREWAAGLVDSDQAELLSAFAFVTTYEADAGRLSAAFVHERIRRSLGHNVARYVIGGWQKLVFRLTKAAENLGVTVMTRHKVVELPAAPVVVATSADAARRLLQEPESRVTGTRVGLFDVVLGDGPDLPSSLLDLDERLYLARYTAFDRSLAPPGEELIQIACGSRPDETSPTVQARIAAVLDSLTPRWRERVSWSRHSLLSHATGTVDLPGSDWRNRTAIKQGAGVFCAGDYVAAPGLLSEVSFCSGLQAGVAAAAFATGPAAAGA